MGKYVFFDIDGTLWDEKMIVPERTKLAIKMLQEKATEIYSGISGEKEELKIKYLSSYKPHSL